MTRLDEITKTLKELKAENKTLREIVKETQLHVMELKSECANLSKKIVGNGVLESFDSQEMGLLESKTLPEVVEETQIPAKANNAKISYNDKLKENRRKRTAKVGLSETEGTGEEKAEEFRIVEIQRKSINDERNWMDMKFNEMISKKTVEDGESLGGTTVEAISYSIPLSPDIGTSCTLKLSNFLDSPLTDPQYHMGHASMYSGPSRVEGHHSEVISFMGKGGCNILCSFAINTILRLTVSCCSEYSGSISFGIGFSPADVPPDHELYVKLCLMPPVPDVWMDNRWNDDSVQRIINHGNLLVRGHMSPGPRSIVNLEVLEMNAENALPDSWHEIKKRIMDSSQNSNTGFQNSRTNSREHVYGKFSCYIEIVNCLNVPLTNCLNLYSNGKTNDFVSPEILPFHKVTFFGLDDENVEAMFSYEIDSTEFEIVTAFKIGPGLNSFSAAVVQRSETYSFTGATELETFRDASQWRTHDYRKYATASEGVQWIQRGNIRAKIRMSEEGHSLLKIRIFAVQQSDAQIKSP